MKQKIVSLALSVLLCVGLTSPAFAAESDFQLSDTGAVLKEYIGPGGDVTIPSTVTWIGGSAFGSCTNLTSVTIPSSVTVIDIAAFSGCTNLTSVTIPSSVTMIDIGAFSGCTGLTDVTISGIDTHFDPATVFTGCTSLTTINIPKNHEQYLLHNGVLFAAADPVLKYCPGGWQGEYTVPADVLKIDDFAFAVCTNLTSVSIPGSVTEIGVNAFGDCTSLTSVNIPDSVTLIERGAFDGCTGLTNVTIPKSCKVEKNAFRGTPYQAKKDMFRNILIGTTILVIFVIAAVVLVLKRKKTAVETADVPPMQKVQLPKSTISPECPQTVPTVKKTLPASGPKFCPNCGKPLTPGVKFCPECGKPLNGGEG